MPCQQPAGHISFSGFTYLVLYFVNIILYYLPIRVKLIRPPWIFNNRKIINLILYKQVNTARLERKINFAKLLPVELDFSWLRSLLTFWHFSPGGEWWCITWGCAEIQDIYLLVRLGQRITFLPVQTEQRHVRTETDRDAQRGYLDLSGGEKERWWQNYISTFLLFTSWELAVPK